MFDLMEVGLAGFLVLTAAVSYPRLAHYGDGFAHRTAWCMALLFFLPIALRLFLLPRQPVPLPDIYDEFSHLLVADTLRHFRFANRTHPMHRFFETFFELQQPSYSSIYPVGQGLVLAIGRALFGMPWAGVLCSTGALCALCYWMLLGWTTPGWALVGGLLAVFQFGSLNPWMNSYWGGAVPAAAGCLIFGALPRLVRGAGAWPSVLLGLGVAVHLLTRPYESIFLLAGISLFFIPYWRNPPRTGWLAAVIVLPAIGVTLVQNRQITGNWTTLPYAESQYQYGVPAALTFQRPPEPHRELTPEQQLDYRMQRNFLGERGETASTYFTRLEYRVRFYRFFLLPPLYLAFGVFLVTTREYRHFWVAATLGIFALGVNFFPAWQYHYIAAETCLFILVSVAGLERISRLNREACVALVCLCAAHFVFWYASAPSTGTTRRAAVRNELNRAKGQQLVFVHYGPQHIFQEEWVWNDADIDAARIVWARDLGPAEDEALRSYYPGRTAWVLDADSRPLPKLEEYRSPAQAAPVISIAPVVAPKPSAPRGLHFEPVPQGR